MGSRDARFEAITQLTEDHLRRLHGLYQAEWWIRNRALDDIRIMVENTDLFIALGEPDTGELVAFARVLTDGIYKALILDMIVDKSYRGRALGRRLMQDILAHPDLGQVRHFELYCLPEMFPFYRIWGFTEQLGDLKLMRLERGEEAGPTSR